MGGDQKLTTAERRAVAMENGLLKEVAERWNISQTTVSNCRKRFGEPAVKASRPGRTPPPPPLLTDPTLGPEYPLGGIIIFLKVRARSVDQEDQAN